MEKVQEWVEDKTNACDFFDSEIWDRPNKFELDLFHTFLIPNGIARWYVNAILRAETLEVNSELIYMLDERLIHPIIAMQHSKKKVEDLLVSLTVLQNDLIDYFDIVKK